MPGGCYIVTGASRGIGLEVARFLLETFSVSGVVAVSRSQPQALLDLSKKHGDRLVLQQGDIAQDAENEKAVHTALQRFGQIDGLVLNAGVLEPLCKIGELDSNSMDAVQKLLNVNVSSLFSMLRHSVRHLRQTQGRVVMVSSGAAGKAYGAWSPYCASKAALNSINACLAVEEPEITTIALRPGVVSTDMQGYIRSSGSSSMPEENYKRFVQLHEEGKLERPEVPAHVMASFVVKGEKELSGQFLDYAEEKLKAHRLA